MKLYQKNINSIKKYRLELYLKLKNLKKENLAHVNFFYKNDILALKINNKNVHSSINPYKEAKVIIQKTFSIESDVYIFLD